MQEGVITCEHCGGEGVVKVGPFGPHYAKLECGKCGAYIKWLPKPVEPEGEKQPELFKKKNWRNDLWGKV